MYQILCLWCQSSQSEVVPGWGQPLILCTPAARLLIADAVSSDGRSCSQPVNSEGVGANVGEVHASWGVQSWRERYWDMFNMFNAVALKPFKMMAPTYDFFFYLKPLQP